MLLLVAAALAAVPVRLPEGQAAEAWTRPLALAGLGVGAPGVGASVELFDEGSRWRVRVHDRSGAIRETWVAEPTTESAREDVAWLAASLLQPVVTKAPVAPTPVTLPPPPAPAPVRAPRTNPTPRAPAPVALVERVPDAPVPPDAPLALEPVDEPVVVAAVVPVEPVVSSAPLVVPAARVGPRLYVLLGTGVGWRPEHTPTSSTWLRAEVSVTREVNLGLALGVESPSGIAVAGEGTSVLAAEGLLQASVVGGHRLSGRGALGIGVSERWFYENGAPVTSGPIPVAGADGAVWFRIGRWARIGPDGGIRVDLRPTEVSVSGGEAQTLSPIEARIGISLRLGKESSDPISD